VSRPRLFVELCCGSAAVTLKLIGGAHAKPPVSYMGAKTGYAEPILWAMGLRSGQGADAVLLNDPGPWSKVWRVLVDPAGCRAVAAIIRGWVGEDARALWERLRAEPVPEDEGAAAARWCWLQGRSLRGAPVYQSGDRVRSMTGDGERRPSFAPSFSSNGVPVWNAVEQADLSSALSRLSFPPTTVLGEDAADVTPEWAARWMFLHHGSFCHKGPEHGIGRPQGNPPDGTFGVVRPSLDIIADAMPRVAGYDLSSAAVANLQAEDIEPSPTLPDRTYVYIDPPYQDTTGYAHAFPRDAVIDVAQRWSDAGAVVCLSEAVPLPLDGWHHVEITDVRKGQKRTFSRQKREWLTLNREPAWVPQVQSSLFA